MFIASTVGNFCKDEFRIRPWFLLSGIFWRSWGKQRKTSVYPASGARIERKISWIGSSSAKCVKEVNG